MHEEESIAFAAWLALLGVVSFVFWLIDRGSRDGTPD